MRREAIIFIALLTLVASGTILLYGNFFNQARCEFGFLASKNAFLGEKFLRSSNIDQEILEISGLTDEDTSVEGWRVYRPSSPDHPGRIRLRVSKDRDTAFFYPRVFGEKSSVVVAEPSDNIVREWVVLRGKDDAWTPISRRYLLNMACIGRGDPATSPPVEIILILSGPWAQIWRKDGAILF